MKVAIESIVDFVLLTILVLISVSLISMHINKQEARKFHALTVDKIENSNFSDNMLDGLRQEARNHGYKMQLNKKMINEEYVVDVILDFNYSIPLLNIVNEPQTIRGTAK